MKYMKMNYIKKNQNNRVDAEIVSHLFIWTEQLLHQRKAISYETSTRIIISKKSGPNENYADQIKGILE